MDPITLIFLVFLFMSIFVFTGPMAVAIQQTKKKKELEASKPEPTYHDRWLNKDYVAMVHNTIALEKQEFGEARTVCECSTCKAIAEGKVVSWSPKDNKTRILPRPDKYTRIVEGYEFEIPNYIPREAKTSLKPFNPGKDTGNLVWAVFTWYRPDGRQMYYSACAWPKSARAGGGGNGGTNYNSFYQTLTGKNCDCEYSRMEVDDEMVNLYLEKECDQCKYQEIERKAEAEIARYRDNYLTVNERRKQQAEEFKKKMQRPNPGYM